MVLLLRFGLVLLASCLFDVGSSLAANLEKVVVLRWPSAL